MTTFKQFMDELNEETIREGQRALDELEDFKQYFGKQRTVCQEELVQQPCLIAAFFKHQQTLPLTQRSTSVMISCPCPRCKTRM